MRKTIMKSSQKTHFGEFDCFLRQLIIRRFLNQHVIRFQAIHHSLLIDHDRILVDIKIPHEQYLLACIWG